MPRDARAYGTNYVNRTQRNAPLWIDVSHDARNVMFVVKTQKPIVGRDGEGDFMRIIANRKVANKLGEVKIESDKMTLVAPRSALGLKEDGPFRMEFKFIDSTVPMSNPLDLYDLGVVEPLGRLNHVYSGK